MDQQQLNYERPQDRLVIADDDSCAICNGRADFPKEFVSDGVRYRLCTHHYTNRMIGQIIFYFFVVVLALVVFITFPREGYHAQPAFTVEKVVFWLVASAIPLSLASVTYFTLIKPRKLVAKLRHMSHSQSKT